jgi:plastocyanin
MSSYRLPRLLAISALAVTLSTWACGGSSDSPSADQDPETTDSPAASAPVANNAPPAAVLGTSAVNGTVVFDGTPPRLKPVAMAADPACATQHDGPVAARSLVLGDGQTLGNVFIQVRNAPQGSYTAPSQPAVIDQKGCLYEPHVLGVMAGQTLQFRNSDGILHNVHGKPKANREFNLGMPGAVTKTDKILDQPEPVFPVKCDVHPWMRSYVAVMSHPYFAVTNVDGLYRIGGLPAGTYEIEAWHEKLGTQTTTVTIEDGQAVETDFTFTAPNAG